MSRGFHGRVSDAGATFARGALACALASLLAGCTSLSMATGPAVVLDSPTATLTVRTFDRAKDVEARHLSTSRVVATLAAKDGRLLRVEGAEAVFDGLAPGDYELTVRLWKGSGATEESPTAEKSKRVSLRAGYRAETNVVVERTSAGTIALVVVGTLAVVALVGAISLHNALSDDDRLTTTGPENRAFSPIPGQRPSTPSQPRVE